MNRKTITAAIALCAALTLAGCGGDDSDDKAGKGGKGGSSAPASSGKGKGDAPATGDSPSADAPADSSLPGTAEGEEGVRQAVTGFFTAVADKDSDAACALMTDKAKKEMTEDSTVDAASCPQALTEVLTLFDDPELTKGYRSIQVGEVKVTGDTATIADDQLTAREGTFLQDDDPTPVGLVRQGGRWLLDSDG